MGVGKQWGEDLPCQRRKNIFREMKFFLEKLAVSSHSGIRKIKVRGPCKSKSSALFFGKDFSNGEVSDFTLPMLVIRNYVLEP